MHGGKRHQFKFLFFPIVVSIVFLILEGLLIESLQFLPEILIELFQRKILALFKLVEKSFFKDAYCVFHGTFELRFADFCRKNDRAVMVSLVGIILIQLRFNPVLINDDSLFTIITDY